MNAYSLWRQFGSLGLVVLGSVAACSDEAPLDADGTNSNGSGDRGATGGLSEGGTLTSGGGIGGSNEEMEMDADVTETETETDAVGAVADETGEDIVDEAGALRAAKSVAIPSVQRHALAPAGDTDCFAFTTTGESVIGVATSDGDSDCPGDTIVYLYAGDETNEGNPLDSNDDRNGSICSELQSTRPAGDYIVCVEHFSRLSPRALTGVHTSLSSEPVKAAPQDDVGGLVAPNAVTLPATEVHDISPVLDADCFAFTLASPRLIAAETSDGSTGCAGDTELFLYAGEEVDANNPIASDDDGGEGVCSRLQSIQPAGDYVLCVEHFSRTLPAEILDLTTLISTSEPPPDTAGGKNAPKAVQLPATELDDISPVGDSDCFAFTTATSQVIVAETSDGAAGCPGNTELFLYSSNGVEVASNDNTGTGNCSRIESVQPEGDYVLCVEHSVQLGAAIIPGVTTSISVANLPVDEAGELSTPKAVALPALESHDIDAQGDADCFSFTTLAPQLINVETSDGASGCPGDTEVFLYAAGETERDNHVVRNDDSGVNNCSLLQTVQPANDYVLCVEHATRPGADVIRGITTAISVTNVPVDEAGDLSAPKVVTLPAVELHDINPQGDVDCFAFTTASSQVINVETSDGAGGCPGDTEVFLYTAGETNVVNQLASNDDAVGGLCSLLQSTQPAGDYVLCVEHFVRPGTRVIGGITTTIQTQATP